MDYGAETTFVVRDSTSRRPTLRSLERALSMREHAVEKFKSAFRGIVIQPDEPGYDETRSIWNAMIDRRPALIARCIGVADVAMCVDFARQHGLTLSVKGGGHNISGLAVCD